MTIQQAIGSATTLVPEKAVSSARICRFLENFSFHSIIAPVTVDDFLANYWEQTPLIVRRDNPGYYDDLFQLEDFDEAIARGPAYIKVAEANSKKNKIHGGTSASTLERTLDEMRSGSTLILDGLHSRDPKLGLLCRLASEEVGHGFQTNLYLTPPHGKGFLPHWDNHCVFVLQIMGSKHWRVEKERRIFPGKAETIDDAFREIRGDTYDFTLNQGDVVYIPRGFVHAAECGEVASLHITLGMHTYTTEEFLHAIVTAAAASNERLRYGLPFGFLRGEQKAMVVSALAALRDAANADFIAAVVDQFRDELIKKFPLDISGQVASYFQARELALDDQVGPRAGVIYRIHRERDTVRVNVGGRAITFPHFFEEPLKFALSIRHFAVREIPGGDLEDAEKLVFVERLIQEGLLVRK